MIFGHFGLTKVPFGDYYLLLFFLGFLSKSKDWLLSTWAFVLSTMIVTYSELHVFFVSTYLNLFVVDSKFSFTYPTRGDLFHA